MSEPLIVDPVALNAPNLWSQANQTYLLAHLARLRQILERHRAESEPEVAVGAAVDAVQAEPLPEPMVHEQPAALDTLCQLFNLSPFERDLLLLCAGMELEASFATLCATLQGNPQRDYPTFALALSTLPEAHWSAITPHAPLRFWQMIQIEPGRSLTRNPLHIDEQVLHYLVGIDTINTQLAGLLQPLTAVGMIAPSHTAVADQIAATWLATSDSGDLPVIQLCGPERESIQAIALAACTQLRLKLYRLPLLAMPTIPDELEQLLRLWQRQAILSESVLLIDCYESERSDGGREATLARWVEAGYQAVGNFRGPLLVASRDRRGPWQRPTLTLDVAKPTGSEQRLLWNALLESTLTEDGAARNGSTGLHSTAEPQGTAELQGSAELHGSADLHRQVERLAGQFNLDLPVIVAATHGAQGRLATQRNGHLPTAQDFGNALWEICRNQARPQLNDLVQPIEAKATWDDLVLPEREVVILDEIAMHVRQRSHVYETWGFAGKGKRGLGISALFAGASGTGKTMAAEVLAHELQLDLYRIDLSAVVSKYIGETEKNLRRVFDAAEAGGAILLFDEADALFGKRSDVKDSHDRYANIEVSYLLQRMEAYRGLAILTTNMKDALDGAFMRRIRFIVQFPFPDVEQRAKIWNCIFPANTPLDGLDLAKLARLNVAGGNIRNIALHAAFLAADASQDGVETPVNMAHLLTAARREYAKLERSLTEAEIRGWV